MPVSTKSRCDFLVTVDLALVAKRLSRGGKRVNVYAAAMELIAPLVTRENSRAETTLSPFAATDVLGTFYCECQPEDLLDRGEIVRVTHSRPRSRLHDGELLGME